MILGVSEVTIKLLSQQFESSAVKVTLAWTSNEGFPVYSYYFSTDPLLEQSFDGNETVELTVLYNTLYNISVVAAHRCSLKNVTSFIELYYSEYHTAIGANHCHNNINISGKCGNPATLLADPSVTIVDYSDPATAGSNVSFSCDPGFVLNGPSTVMCMSDGLWKPDPRISVCKSKFCISVFIVHL